MATSEEGAPCISKAPGTGQRRITQAVTVVTVKWRSLSRARCCQVYWGKTRGRWCLRRSTKREGGRSQHLPDFRSNPFHSLLQLGARAALYTESEENSKKNAFTQSLIEKQKQNIFTDIQKNDLILQCLQYLCPAWCGTATL